MCWGLSYEIAEGMGGMELMCKHFLLSVHIHYALSSKLELKLAPFSRQDMYAYVTVYVFNNDKQMKH